MTIYEILTDPDNGLGLPCVYAHYKNDEGEPAITPPYITYAGAGQSDFPADNTYYWKRNRYQVEYYFTKKDEAQENAIEQLLLDNGFLYDKSEDIFIESENVFVIYYTI